MQHIDTTIERQQTHRHLMTLTYHFVMYWLITDIYLVPREKNKTFGDCNVNKRTFPPCSWILRSSSYLFMTKTFQPREWLRVCVCRLAFSGGDSIIRILELTT